MYAKLTFLWFALVASASAQEVSSATPDKYPAQMEFTTFSPCRGSASFCGLRILARGEIDKGAPERLKALLAHYDYTLVIAFDSPGGSLSAGLELGALIRARGMNTEVAPEYTAEVLTADEQSSEIVVVATNVGCFSACAYAFMGGVSRTLENGGRIGVHQFQGAQADGESVAQSITALISQYMLAMGVDRDVLDVAGLTAADEITLVSNADAVRYNLDNQSPAKSKWELTALEGGTRAVKVIQQHPGEDRTTTIILVVNDEDASQLYAIVGYGPIDQNSKAPSEMEVTTGGFCGEPGECMQIRAAKNWEYDAKRDLYVGYFAFRLKDFLNAVRNSDTIRFDAGLPNALSGYSPSVELGTEGLKNALIAIY